MGQNRVQKETHIDTAIFHKGAKAMHGGKQTLITGSNEPADIHVGTTHLNPDLTSHTKLIWDEWNP